MKRYELIQALESFDDETDIKVCHTDGQGLCDIVRVTYAPAFGDTPAFLCIAIPVEHVGAANVVMRADRVL